MINSIGFLFSFSTSSFIRHNHRSMLVKEFSLLISFSSRSSIVTIKMTRREERKFNNTTSIVLLYNDYILKKKERKNEQSIDSSWT